MFARASNKPGSLTVYSPLAVTQPCATQCEVEEGCSVCGRFGSVSGGFGYHYKITTDNRPDGMGVTGLIQSSSATALTRKGRFVQNLLSAVAARVSMAALTMLEFGVMNGLCFFWLSNKYDLLIWLITL